MKIETKMEIPDHVKFWAHPIVPLFDLLICWSIGAHPRHNNGHFLIHTALDIETKSLLFIGVDRDDDEAIVGVLASAGGPDVVGARQGSIGNQVVDSRMPPIDGGGGRDHGRVGRGGGRRADG